MRNAHPNLNDFQITYGCELAKKLYLNNNRDIKVPITEHVSQDVRQKCTLNYGHKKGNPRRYLICNRLFMSVGDHLMKYHKLARESVMYEDKLRNAPVIPKCYTKTVRGEIVELSGDELEAAKSEYDSTVKVHTEELKIIKAVSLLIFFRFYMVLM